MSAFDVPGGFGGMLTGYETRVANTILGLNDRGKLIDLTAAITQTFEPDGTLDDGWWVILRNATDDGTTVVVLNPDGAETIDGLATLTMYSGETRMVVCSGDAGNFNSILLSGGYAKFIASGSFVVPHGISRVEIEVVGAGGAGGPGVAGNPVQGGGGGGGASRTRQWFGADELGNPGDSIAVTVAGTAASGISGGNTTFSTFLTAYGGGHGATGVAVTGSTIQGGGGASRMAAASGTTSGSPSSAAAVAGEAATSAVGAAGTSAEGGGGAGGGSRDGGTAFAGGGSIDGCPGGGGGGGRGVGSRDGGQGGLRGTYAVGGGANGGAASGGVGGAGNARQGGGGGAGHSAGGGAVGGAGGVPGCGGGGGGSGTTSGGAGGTGGRGECRVWYS